MCHGMYLQEDSRVDIIPSVSPSRGVADHDDNDPLPELPSANADSEDGGGDLRGGIDLNDVLAQQLSQVEADAARRQRGGSSADFSTMMQHSPSTRLSPSGTRRSAAEPSVVLSVPSPDDMFQPTTPSSPPEFDDSAVSDPPEPTGSSPLSQMPGSAQTAPSAATKSESVHVATPPRPSRDMTLSKPTVQTLRISQLLTTDPLQSDTLRRKSGIPRLSRVSPGPASPSSSLGQCTVLGALLCEFSFPLHS